MKKVNFETIASHMKDTGFVFQGSEIYGGLSNTWDFGPLGVEFKNNIKNAWWKKFIQEDPNNVGLQSAILMNPQVWVASGHVGGFSDPLMDCKKCNTRFRADQLIEEFSKGEVNLSGWSKEEMASYIENHKISCPKCSAHTFTDIREFNLMFKTFQGVIEDATSQIYLRPETAQGIFVNFKNIQRTMRKKLPFGVGQIGKSFRNEITPGNFIFRLREFEQMELEFFTAPGEDLQWYVYYKDFCMNWLTTLGVCKDNLRLREHDAEELAHYSKGTSDIEYDFGGSIGWGEIWGISDRSDFDLRSHQEESKKSLEYLDSQTNEKHIAYCIEPSVGVERLMLAILADAYEEEVLEKDTRVVLHLHPYLAPYKAAVLPLSKVLSEEAKEVFHLLAPQFSTTFDETQNIGKRYRRQDEIGTPFCITYDFDSKEDACVTVRNRDTMQQERVKISQLSEYILEKIKF
ncbi:MAG: glycine--tRNA ligase [Breznakia sp.]